MLDIDFPAKLSFLLTTPARFKVVYGGRVAGKTINAIRAAILFARDRYLEIVCFRELQKSIQESIHGGICAEINALGINDEFDIKNNEIVHNLTGARFTFESLRFNITKIKSRARIDIALLEESDNVSKSSLDILIPTVRSREYAPGDFGGPFGIGPEIWILFNPKLDSDEVYKRFVLQKDRYAPDYDKNGNRYAIVQKINWSDNKWFPDDQRREMEIMKAADEDEWLHIWEGNTKQVLAGAVYTAEIKKTLLEGRRKHVPYNPNKSVNTFWDIGFRDKMAIWFVQHNGVEYNLIRYYENQLQKMPFYIHYLQSLEYNYGVMNLPHDGDADTASNITPKRQLQDVGYKVRIIKRPSRKAVGINAVRTLFDLCNFDEENTADGWQCLCRYAYEVNEADGVFSRDPDHDTPWSHGADAMQTFGLSAKPEQTAKKPVIISTNRSATYRPNANSWMES